MDGKERRSYRGPIKTVILDWAGTTVDYGSFAPVAVFVAVFARHGVTISAAQARGPMGLEKRDHIHAVAALPEVAASWRAAHGHAPEEAEIKEMFHESVALQASTVADHATPVPGVTELLAACRARGLKTGGSTGYSRPIMEVLAPAAARLGYAPDTWVCPNDVPAGRPAPWMIYQNMINLGVYPLDAVIKVGDTIPDVEEGVNAGVWTVAVTESGNEMGLSPAEVAALPAAERLARNQVIGQRLSAAGAHYVIPTVADLLPILDEIEGRLRQGERP